MDIAFIMLAAACAIWAMADVVVRLYRVNKIADQVDDFHAQSRQCLIRGDYEGSSKVLEKSTQVSKRAELQVEKLRFMLSKRTLPLTIIFLIAAWTMH